MGNFVVNWGCFVVFSDMHSSKWPSCFYPFDRLSYKKYFWSILGRCRVCNSVDN